LKESVFPIQNRFLEGTLDDVMPTPGLCRVNWILNAPHCLWMMADAA